MVLESILTSVQNMGGQILPPPAQPPPTTLRAQTLYRTAEVCRKIMALAFPLAELELVVRPNSSAYTCEVLGWIKGR